ncbi:MAG: alanine racemase, partial [Bacteroidota bacterium]
MQADWYTINNIDEIDSPALVIYPERVKENIRILKTFVPDLNRLRPHIKTNKSPEVVRLMIDSGISKFKCATIAEAEMLAMEGAADVLLAYQPVGPKGKRFAELSKKFSNIRFSCLVDNERTAQQLSDVGKKYGPINVFVDLNVGMNRTGIAPTDALDLCLKIAKMDDLTFAGLHAYDGHLRDAELEIRTKKVNQAFEAVEKLQTDILKATGQTPVIVAGGTP